MAQNVDTLEEDLTCPVCVDVFRELVRLPCQHSFCRECLEEYVSKSGSKPEGGDVVDSESGSRTIFCPVCRSRSDLGVKGVAGLPVQLTLASIVEKYRSGDKAADEILNCSMCEDEEKKPAVNFCVTCSVFYCQGCVAALHPMRGPLKRHNLITVADYLSRQHLTRRTGNQNGVVDNSDQCDDHGLEILLFCGPCQRPLCKKCLREHDGHPLKDLAVLYEDESKLLEDETVALEQLKDDMDKMLTELAKLRTDIEEKKSLHITEIDKTYKEAIEAVNKWRRDSLKTTEERHEKWRLACVEATKSLKLKMEEIESLIRSSKELLSGHLILLLKGRGQLSTRIGDETKSTEKDLQRHRDVSAKCRDDMNSDVVIPRELFVKEKTISTPKLRFTEKLSDSVLIKDNDTTLVNVKQESKGFTGALTDGSFLTGSYYWEFDLNFHAKKTQMEGGLVYSAGVVRKGSDIGDFVGAGNLSWGVDVTYSDNEYTFTGRHKYKCVDTSVPVYPDSVSERGTVRQGFYLNCEKRTLMVIDLTYSRVLCTFRDLDLNEPLRLAVGVYNYNWVDVSVSLIPCNLSGLSKVLNDTLK